MPVFYIIYQSFRKETVGELILRERWNTTQSTDGMTFYHVIGWPIKNVILQLSRRPQSLTVVVIHISYMSRDAITQSLDRQVGMHNKIGAYHAFLSRDLIMLIEVIKSTTSKLALMKSTHSYRTCDLWLRYLDKWRASNHNFYESFKALNLKDKNNT